MKQDKFVVKVIIWIHHWATLFGSLVGVLTFGTVRTSWSLDTARWIARKRYQIKLKEEGEL